MIYKGIYKDTSISRVATCFLKVGSDIEEGELIFGYADDTDSMNDDMK